MISPPTSFFPWLTQETKKWTRRLTQRPPIFNKANIKRMWFQPARNKNFCPTPTSPYPLTIKALQKTKITKQGLLPFSLSVFHITFKISELKGKYIFYPSGTPAGAVGDWNNRITHYTTDNSWGVTQNSIYLRTNFRSVTLVAFHFPEAMQHPDWKQRTNHALTYYKHNITIINSKKHSTHSKLQQTTSPFPPLPQSNPMKYGNPVYYNPVTLSGITTSKIFRSPQIRSLVVQ